MRFCMRTALWVDAWRKNGSFSSLQYYWMLQLLHDPMYLLPRAPAYLEPFSFPGTARYATSQLRDTGFRDIRPIFASRIRYHISYLGR